MKTIKEITFVHETIRCTYKIYTYEQETIRKIKVKTEVGEITTRIGYKYVDTKVNVEMYAIHRESEIDGKYQEILICETESYATILSILKDILEEYITLIKKLQTPAI